LSVAISSESTRRSRRALAPRGSQVGRMAAESIPRKMDDEDSASMFMATRPSKSFR
jgi:hypothetical protein